MFANKEEALSFTYTERTGYALRISMAFTCDARMAVWSTSNGKCYRVLKECFVTVWLQKLRVQCIDCSLQWKF